MKYIKKNKATILLEMLVCITLFLTAYGSRGYLAFGGEALLPIALIIAHIYGYKENKKNDNTF